VAKGELECYAVVNHMLEDDDVAAVRGLPPAEVLSVLLGEGPKYKTYNKKRPRVTAVYVVGKGAREALVPKGAQPEAKRAKAT